MNYNSLPVRLKSFNQWVYWTDSKKIPMSPLTFKPAKANDPSTWSDFNVAVNVVNNLPSGGLGFFFTEQDPFIGVDIDHCFHDDGSIDDDVVDFLHWLLKNNFDGYIEKSMSGSGLHIIIESSLPSLFLGDRLGRKIGKYEFYSAKHYLALTANFLDSNKIPSISVVPPDVLESKLSSMFPDEFNTTETNFVVKPENGKSIFDSINYDPDYDDKLVSWLCDKVPKFNSAYTYGSADDFNGDQSKRDFFVMTQLLSLFHGDVSKMQNFFKQSACMNDLDRKVKHQSDYLKRSFDNAVTEWRKNGSFEYNVQINVTRKSLFPPTPKTNLDTSSVHQSTNSDEVTPFEDLKPHDTLPTITTDTNLDDSYDDFGVDDDVFFRSTDRRNATIFVDVNQDYIRFCVDLFRDGAFLLWQKNIWKPLINNVPCWNLIPPTTKKLRKMWFNSKSTKERKAIAFSCRRLEMSAGVESCLSWVRADYRVQVDRNQLNQQRYKISFTNGTFDFDSMKFYDSSPSDLFTLSTGYSFKPDEQSELWINTVKTILPDPDTRESLQKFLGLCLTGDVTQEKFSYFFGLGGNGKSTILKTIINVLGDFAAVIPISVFAHQNYFSGESPTPQLAKLEYARLVVADEIPSDISLDNAKIKNLTGGDHVTVRPLYSPPVTFDPQFKLILSGNVQARFSLQNDVGINRRLLFFPFNQRFTDENSNRFLKRELSKLHNLQGIFNWLLQGYQKFLQSGLTESDEMTQARLNYLTPNENEVSKFFKTYCVLDPKGRIPRSEFLNQYFDKNPHSKLTQKEVINSLMMLDSTLHFVNYGGVKVIAGISWIPEENQSQ